MDPFPMVMVPPANESALDPSFSEYYKSVREKVNRRDTAGLLALLHPDIKNSFGGDDGIAAFQSLWKLDADPAASPVWPLLADMLRLGGTFTRQDRTAFAAPYVYTRFPETMDAFQHAVVIGSDVNVRATPSLDGEIIGRVSHLVVRYLHAGEDQAPSMEYTVEIDGRSYPWIRIGLPTGKAGYVAGKYIWTPVGYRAGFEKLNTGQWKMTFLLAGD
ncbi:MAG: SH3 domain-containing protein [Firmicutes bacterium]|nr:SH3 domain-containing protein [Bacillota bacterium]